MRFSILTLLVVILFAAVACKFLFPPNPIKSVNTTAEWESATENTFAVVFVDADCNGWMTVYRNRVDEYAAWFMDRYGKQAIFVDTSPGSSLNEPKNIEQPLFDLLQQFWQTHDVPTGGMKTIGGAGTVAWIKDGILVDHEFIGMIETLDEMSSRSNSAFQQANSAR